MRTSWKGMRGALPRTRVFRQAVRPHARHHAYLAWLANDGQQTGRIVLPTLSALPCTKLSLCRSRGTLSGRTSGAVRVLRGITQGHSWYFIGGRPEALTWSTVGRALGSRCQHCSSSPRVLADHHHISCGRSPAATAVEITPFFGCTQSRKDGVCVRACVCVCARACACTRASVRLLRACNCARLLTCVRACAHVRIHAHSGAGCA